MNFKYAISLANTLYDIDISDEDDAVEVGLIAYNKIGNKNTVLKKDVFDVDCKTGEVLLPCGVTLIEAVTLCHEDWNHTDNIHDNGDVNSLYTEHYIESRKAFLDPLYVSGSFVKYRRSGDTLYTNKTFGKVTILYHLEILDEDGLPEINDKEALAIADYIAYTSIWKEARRSNNSGLLQMAQDIKRLFLFHLDGARVPEYISQNDLDKVLNMLTTSNRKFYGKSYKPNL